MEGKKVRLNPIQEVVSEMRQLYDRGVRGFWFTDVQFIPAKRYIEDAKELLRAIKSEGLTDIRWAAYIRADNLDPELAQLMVETGMSYFEIGSPRAHRSTCAKCAWGTTCVRCWRAAGCSRMPVSVIMFR